MYQQDEQPVEQRMSNDCATSEQRVSTPKELKKNKKEKHDKHKTSGEDYFEVFPDCLNTDDFKIAWGEWVVYRQQIKKPLKSVLQRQKSLDRLVKYGEVKAIKMIQDSISHGWQGIYEDKNNSQIIPEKPQITFFQAPDNWEKGLAE